MEKESREARSERLSKENDALTASLLPLMLILQAIALAVKLYLGGGMTCLLDAISLLAGVGVAVVMLTVKGVWRAEDEEEKEERISCLNFAGTAMIVVLIFGTYIADKVDGASILWYIPTTLVWVITAIVMLVIMIIRACVRWVRGMNVRMKQNGQ